MSDFSRRSLVRGVAWTVPVVAVAANAPAFATSQLPPPPGVNLSGACANTGTSTKGCGVNSSGVATAGSTEFTLQVPVTVTNTSAVPIVFQVVSMFTNNGDNPPTAATDPGTFSGVSGIVATDSSFTENGCTTTTPSGCGGGVQNGSVVVAANTTAYFFVLSPRTDNASKFSATITTRLLSAGCSPIAGTTATTRTATAISKNNCD